MNHPFADLGWVDFDFGYSARAEEILGEWAEHLVENLNQVYPTQVREVMIHSVQGDTSP